MSVCMSVCMCVCIGGKTGLRLPTCITSSVCCMYICMYVCMYVCMHVCKQESMCKHTYMHVCINVSYHTLCELMPSQIHAYIIYSRYNADYTRSTGCWNHLDLQFNYYPIWYNMSIQLLPHTAHLVHKCVPGLASLRKEGEKGMGSSIVWSPSISIIYINQFCIQTIFTHTIHICTLHTHL